MTYTEIYEFFKAKRGADLTEYLLATAKASPCKKRKVGAIVIGLHAEKVFYSSGYNTTLSNKPCEDEHGETVAEVVHAEVNALMHFAEQYPNNQPTYVVVTHPPCAGCTKAILDAGIAKDNIIVMEQFMKFDSNKPRYDLIPPSATHALADVLTYGARKYKPNNWRNGDIDRYIAATMRHFEAYRAGETHDNESNRPHLWHALTNLAFLIELDETQAKAKAENPK